MFGHQNDIISQDQKNDASVTIPESALDALTAPPASGSQTDSPVVQQQSDSPIDDAIGATSAPTLAPTSIDGFTAPSTKLSSPFSYMQSDIPASFASTNDDKKDEPKQKDIEAEEIDDADLPAPIELSNEQQETALFSAAPNPNNEEERMPTDDYLDTLVTDEPTTVAPTNTDEPVEVADAASEHLLAIKQEALNELSPLVGQLNLDPEEKFHTVMMLIRASDNQTLIGDAYTAAKAIPDEKIRAQALLDVVNEINYFTGHESVAA